MATRTVGVFAHRLYGAITTAHYMAEVVPFVKPETVVRQSQYFGPSVAAMPIHGEQQLPRESGGAAGPLRTIRNLGVFGVNLAGLTIGAPVDTEISSTTSTVWKSLRWATFHNSPTSDCRA